MVDWTPVLIALAAGIPATIAAISASIGSWKNSRKIDDNTELTKAGTQAAASAASSAKIAVSDLSRALNGELDRKIKAAIDDAISPVNIAISAIRSDLHRLGEGR